VKIACLGFSHGGVRDDSLCAFEERIRALARV
jgi:hypothetical protein